MENTCPELQVSKAINTDKEIFKFRNSFYKIVEELRMRRHIDVENEGKITQLMEQSHCYMQSMDEQKQKYSELEKALQQSKKLIKDQFNEEQKQLEEEKAKLEVICGVREEKIKSLTDEIRSLQMNKHTLEKRLRELDTLVATHSDSHDVCMKQVEGVEQQCAELSVQVASVFEQLDLLHANVSESVVLNKKLAYVNCHQNCTVEDLKKQLSMKNKELIQAKSEFHLSPESSDVVSCIDSNDLREQNNLIAKLQDELNHLHEEHCSTLQSLSEAHQLIKKHVVACNKALELESSFKAQIDKLTSDLEKSQSKVHTQERMMEETLEQEKSKRLKLDQTVADLSQRLKALQVDYTSLESTHDLLDAKLSAMTDENSMLKLEVEKHKKLQEDKSNTLALYHTAGTQTEDYHQSCLNAQIKDSSCEKEATNITTTPDDLRNSDDDKCSPKQDGMSFTPVIEASFEPMETMNSTNLDILRPPSLSSPNKTVNNRNSQQGEHAVPDSGEQIIVHKGKETMPLDDTIHAPKRMKMDNTCAPLLPTEQTVSASTDFHKQLSPTVSTEEKKGVGNMHTTSDKNELNEESCPACLDEKLSVRPCEKQLLKAYNSDKRPVEHSLHKPYISQTIPTEEPDLFFSDDDDDTNGETDSASTMDLAHQIRRVELYLKKDRLKRTRHT